MIFVTGATGQLGRLTIAALLKKIDASQIVAGARDPARAKDLGVAVRVADYARPDGWPAALEGVKKLILISSSEVGQRVQQHQTVIDAARAAHLELLVYTSILHADTSPIALTPEHLATERAIAAAGLRAVVLRNGWYLENYASVIASGVATGQIFGAAGPGRIAAAARADYAEALATVVTTRAELKPIYELAGDVGFTMSELAAAIAKVAGKPVTYTDLPPAEYKDLLIKVGLPEPVAVMLADADAGIAKGALDDRGHALSRLIGRATTPLADVITNRPAGH